MSSEIKYSVFPSSKFEALALLYVEKNATSDMTPAGYVELYTKALEEMKKHHQNSNNYFGDREL